jgi:hypothetical protein
MMTKSEAAIRLADAARAYQTAVVLYTTAWERAERGEDIETAAARKVDLLSHHTRLLAALHDIDNAPPVKAVEVVIQPVDAEGYIKIDNGASEVEWGNLLDDLLVRVRIEVIEESP